MIDTPDLIESLARDTRRLRPVRSPLARAGGWLLLAAAIMLLLGIAHGIRPDIGTQLQKPSFVLGIAASLLTGVLAAIGCLMASLPDRSRRWLLLPLPSLALWVSTIGYGCLTDWVSIDSTGMHPGEAVRCFVTLLVVSLPLSLAMFAMLRHAARLRPAALTVTAGLAVAAITSTALSLFHPLDASIMILIWNLGTAALLVTLEGAAGRRLLARFARLSSFHEKPRPG
ncbi:NrsF family protein [Rhodopila globiformis]|uniref:DUF1109 domain-containing protein n=1 Tax=Rhodopila globiformis TaxID=1071 RepID=A0A2S6NP01_RHOGL|nr:NrsF family protein [Rhodopila globiformis]PPQ39527.1 hypothetical protein CCS01_01130 [Rhodopila globiformis]